MAIAAKAWREGTNSVNEIKEIARDVIESGTLNQVEYLEIIDPESLARLEDLTDLDHFIIATAVFCEGIRLIDNMETKLD